MKPIDKYKIICFVFKKFCHGQKRIMYRMLPGSYHRHHIKPRSIFPESTDDKNNIVTIHEYIHYMLHYYLYEYSISEKDDTYKNMKYAITGLETYINNNRSSNYKIDFSNRKNIISKCDMVIEKWIVDSKKLFYSYKEEYSKYENELETWKKDFSNAQRKRYSGGNVDRCRKPIKPKIDYKELLKPLNEIMKVFEEYQIKNISDGVVNIDNMSIDSIIKMI